MKELNCPCVCARACALVYFRGLFVLHVNPYFPVNVEVFKVAEELKHTRYSWKGIRSCVCFNRKASRLFPSRPPDNLLGRRAVFCEVHCGEEGCICSFACNDVMPAEDSSYSFYLGGAVNRTDIVVLAVT